MATAAVKLSLDNAEFMARMAASQAKLAEFGASMRALVLSAGAAIGAIAGVYGVTQGLGKALDEAANMEKLETSFATLIGNTADARRLLADLASFADSTPFELNDIAPASKKLLAYGFAAKDIIPTLRMLGDVASGLDVPLGELVDVFGKNIAQGRLFQEDINQFQSRGIPIVEALAKTMGKNESAIRGMVTEGKVGSAELLAAFQSLTGPGSRFGGMMDQQSKTFAGMLSTIADRISALFREFGAPLTAALKPVLAWVDQNLAAWKTAATEWGQRLASAIGVAFQAIKDGRLGELLSLSIEAGAALGFDALLRHGQAAIGTIAAMLGAIGQGLSAADGPLAYLGEAEYWLGVAALAGAAFLKVANGFANALDEATGGWLSDMSDRVQEDLMEVAEIATPGATVRTDSERLAEVKAMRLADKKRNADELDKTMADAIASQKAYLGRAIAAVPDMLKLATDAYADSLATADGSPEVRKTGEAAFAKLKELYASLDKSASEARKKFTPAELTGEARAGKNFAAPAEAGKTHPLATIADSLARVGGGGRFVAGGAADPLVAIGNRQYQEARRQTQLLEQIAARAPAAAGLSLRRT